MGVKDVPKGQVVDEMKGRLSVTTTYPRFMTLLANGQQLDLTEGEVWNVPEDAKVRFQVLGLLAGGTLIRTADAAKLPPTSHEVSDVPR